MSADGPAHLAAAHAAIRAANEHQQKKSTANRRVQYARLRDPTTAGALRVNKWDAQILDAEILGLLKSPAKALFAMFEPGVADRVKPEVDALLGALLFCFSTGLRRVRACGGRDWVMRVVLVLTLSHAWRPSRRRG